MGTIGIYCRLSKDAEGRAENVGTQERLARAYAAERWPQAPVRVFADNDLSAATPGTVRPGYEEMLAALRRGELVQVVTAEQSRVTRQPAEWEELVVVLARAGVEELHTYRKGTVSIAGSKLTGRIMAAVDAEEVERLRARVNEKLSALAAEGRPPGGSSYGYRRVLDGEGRKAFEVDPDQAAVIREAADRLLAGWSLTAIASDLTDRGVPTARGGRWAATTVRSMLNRPTIAGLRVHRGEVVGPGNWEPILDPAQWRRVVAVLEAPVAVTRSNGTAYQASRTRATGRRYLLTGGTATCGRCGTALVAQQRRTRAGNRTPSYLCSPTRGGCAGIGIAAEPLEAHVAEQLLERLAHPDFIAAVSTDAAEEQRRTATDALANVEARSSELAALWAAGDLSSADWAAARQRLDVERSRLSADLNALPVPEAELDPTTVAADWPYLTLDEQRFVIDRYIAAVTIGPARPGTRTFDPERARISWRA